MNASANLMKKYFKIWANLSTNIRLLKFIRKIGFNFSLKFDANLPKNFVNFVLNFKKCPNFSVNSRKISYKSSNIKSNFTSHLVLKSHKISSSLHQISSQNINPRTNLVQISKADKNTNDFKFNEQILLKPAGKRS